MATGKKIQRVGVQLLLLYQGLLRAGVAEGSQKDTVFGSGEYGSMEALVSAIVLDRESQNFLLDKDPSQ